jgi:hypothetical protein
VTRLAQALDSRRIILCVGSGGVGKTTTAAALAVEAARRGRRTAVLTVDPSHRLKDALGLGSLSSKPRRVPLASIGARGAHLDALLLDVKRTFDELVLALAGSPEQARAVLENRLYQNLSGTLAGTAEYMAVEQVYRLAEEGGYDLLVVDTPPARHAVDFLDAPRRLARLLDSRAFAILKDPTSILPAAGSRLAHMILAAVLRGLERFTGIGLVREVGDFVRVIEDLTGASPRASRPSACSFEPGHGAAPRDRARAAARLVGPRPRARGDGAHDRRHRRQPRCRSARSGARRPIPVRPPARRRRSRRASRGAGPTSVRSPRPGGDARPARRVRRRARRRGGPAPADRPRIARRPGRDRPASLPRIRARREAGPWSAWVSRATRCRRGPRRACASSAGAAGPWRGAGRPSG